MSWFAKGSSKSAARGRRVPMRWVLFLLGIAGLNAVVLLWRDSGSRTSQAASASHAPPPPQLNKRRAATTTQHRPAAKGDSRSAPRLTLSTARLDLGEGKPNEILRGELALTNPGATSVSYTLIKHCGCTELSPRSGTLAPGEKETIRVGVELPDHANSEKNTLVEVQAGDSATIVASCALVARCPAPFQVAPSYVTFGALANDELSESREVHLWSAGVKPQALLENLQIEHGNNAFVVATAVAESPGDPSAALQGPTGLGTGSAVTIRITLNRGLTRGDHYDVLDLRLSPSGHSMRVPLHVQVTEAVRVVPSTVYLRHDVVNGGFQPVVFLVVGRKSAQPLGAVWAVGAPAGTSVEDLGATTNGARRCRLSVGSWPNSTDQPEIALSVEGVDNPFAIKLRRPSRK